MTIHVTRKEKAHSDMLARMYRDVIEVELEFCGRDELTISRKTANASRTVMMTPMRSPLPGGRK